MCSGAFLPYATAAAPLAAELSCLTLTDEWSGHDVCAWPSRSWGQAACCSTKRLDAQPVAFSGHQHRTFLPDWYIQSCAPGLSRSVSYRALCQGLGGVFVECVWCCRSVYVCCSSGLQQRFAACAGVCTAVVAVLCAQQLGRLIIPLLTMSGAQL